MLDTVRWKPLGKAPLPGQLRMIDQTRLPEELVYVETDEINEIYDCIRRLVVRGAPAIGIAAAFGLAASVQHRTYATATELLDDLRKNAAFLAAARPTAVNLSWALERCVDCIAQQSSDEAGIDNLRLRLLQEAEAILREDIAMCRQIGEHGLQLFGPDTGVLTHCNAGALATGDYGTALSPVYLAFESGLSPHVYADETRPLLQGSRLTAWELQRAGVDVTTVCDSMAAQLMQEDRIDLVIVGADRIAANGDVANKIGTYGVAVLAKFHGVPFYVAAPYSTIDPATPSGKDIPIEQRDAAEIACGFGRRTAPDDVGIYNPAFDVTPRDLITGIITERGILQPPYTQAIKKLFRPSS